MKYFILLIFLISVFTLGYKFLTKRKNKKPECEKYWTTLYYGPRGSGKTLHQAKEVLSILEYLKNLYDNNPSLKHRAIIYSIQLFSKEISEKYSEYLYYWKDAKDLQYCPRKNCWKGNEPHRLHGAYVIFDDIATILPADNWTNTPMWLRKTFSQARHFGIRILANLQDPFSCDINFRRYTDIAYRFNKIIGSPDPDETKPAIKHIWGIYVRRKIKAEMLWKVGDMPTEDIIATKLKAKEMAKIRGGNNPLKNMWRASFHIINKKITTIYDTTQDVPEYKPAGYSHREIGCIDPAHNHTDKKAPNYCGFKKVIHELV
jgi:hypothetical protein